MGNKEGEPEVRKLDLILLRRLIEQDEQTNTVRGMHTALRLLKEGDEVSALQTLRWELDKVMHNQELYDYVMSFSKKSETQ